MAYEKPEIERPWFEVVLLVECKAHSDRDRIRNVQRHDGQGEHGIDRLISRKDEQAKQRRKNSAEPYRVHGRLCVRVHTVQPSRERECSVTAEREHLARRREQHGCAHHILHDDNDCPYSESAMLSETVEENCCHGLSNWVAQDAFKVRTHAECKRDIDSFENMSANIRD